MALQGHVLGGASLDALRHRRPLSPLSLDVGVGCQPRRSEALCGIESRRRRRDAEFIRQPKSRLLALAAATAGFRRLFMRPGPRSARGRATRHLVELVAGGSTAAVAIDDRRSNADGATQVSTHAVLPSLTEAEHQQLRMGGQVQKQERDGHTGWGFVVMDVDAPPSTILGCLEAFQAYPGMIPVVRQAEVVSRGRNADGTVTARCNYRVSKFWLSISAVHHVDLAGGLVRFDLDPDVSGMVLREASGFWHVTPSPEGGSGRSRVWLRVGLRASSFLPHALVDYAAERALRRATTWLRPHVEQLWAAQQRRAARLPPTTQARLECQPFALQPAQMRTA
mmetsp:Transcript_133200/g.297216  ORF Transcript_133200/g.297216 Transcript_133200/m.297216 type:complete len:338 (+) Transcript_133200:110-1123(+)